MGIVFYRLFWGVYCRMINKNYEYRSKVDKTRGLPLSSLVNYLGKLFCHFFRLTINYNFVDPDPTGSELFFPEPDQN